MIYEFDFGDFNPPHSKLSFTSQSIIRSTLLLLPASRLDLQVTHWTRITQIDGLALYYSILNVYPPRHAILFVQDYGSDILTISCTVYGNTIRRLLPSPLFSSPLCQRNKSLFPATATKNWSDLAMAESRMHTFALVMFGGHVLYLALATDFVMISKKFVADGLNPACISSTNLQDITNVYGPFLFGREDLRDRIQIYDDEEAMTPFYQLEDRSLKLLTLDWGRSTFAQVRAGDRIIIVLIGHGNSDGYIELNPQHGPV